MIKQTIKFFDFNDEEVYEDHYFNISKKKFLELEATYQEQGGFAKHLMSVADTNSALEAMKAFELLVDVSYGVRSPDGKRFDQSPEALRDFQSSPAYDEFIVSLLSDPKKASDFFTGTLPKDFQQTLKDNNEEFEALRTRYTNGELSNAEFNEELTRFSEKAKPAPKVDLTPVSNTNPSEEVANSLMEKVNRGTFGQTVDHESPEEKRARLQRELDNLN